MSDHTERFDTKDYRLNKDSKTGIYLIHGFTSSTYEIKDLAHFLADKGYRVSAGNLPGHGTTVENCNRIKYTDWLTHVEQEFSELYAECDKVFVGGVSMGSLLAIHISLLFPLAGLITAAPLVNFYHRFKTKYVNPITCRFIPKLSKRGRYPKDVRDTFNFYGYNFYPMRALNEVSKLAEVIKGKIDEIKTPILIQYAENDVAVPPGNAKLIRENVRSEQIWYTGYFKTTHNMWDNEIEKEEIFNEILRFINSQCGKAA